MSRFSDSWSFSSDRTRCSCARACVSECVCEEHTPFDEDPRLHTSNFQRFEFFFFQHPGWSPTKEVRIADRCGVLRGWTVVSLASDRTLSICTSVSERGVIFSLNASDSGLIHAFRLICEGPSASESESLQLYWLPRDSYIVSLCSDDVSAFVCLGNVFSRACGPVCLFASANRLLFGRFCILFELYAFSNNQRCGKWRWRCGGFSIICLYCSRVCLELQIHFLCVSISMQNENKKGEVTSWMWSSFSHFVALILLDKHVLEQLLANREKKQWNSEWKIFLILFHFN